MRTPPRRARRGWPSQAATPGLEDLSDDDKWSVYPILALRSSQLEHRRGVLPGAGGAGHIGSALSIADILASLFAERASTATDPDRDRLVLSKGHAASRSTRARRDRARCPTSSWRATARRHAARRAPRARACPASTSRPARSATGSRSAPARRSAARLPARERRAFVLISDAEMQRGLGLGGRHVRRPPRLGHLVAIVDLNGQQALGYTRDVLDLGRVAERGARSAGTSTKSTATTPPRLRGARRPRGTSTAAARAGRQTTFGKGVSYMESKIEWHYLPMADEQYAQAIEE